LLSSLRAVDQWAAAHGGQHSEHARTEIKAILGKHFSRNGEPGDPPLELVLTECTLHSIPAELAQASTLQKVDLRWNQLTSFPAEMAQVTALQTLELGVNLLSSFPAEMVQAKALQTLNLGTNQLTSFPAEMAHATALQNLDLGWNRLSSFPAEMAQVKTLQTLDLGQNRLTSFPAEMGQATALQTLDLGQNQLTSFPAEMGQAKALRKLDLGVNQLTSFPAEMGQATALQTLILVNNRLTSFPAEMGQAKALQTLDLESNRLTTFPAEIGQAKALQTLNLRDNALTTLPAEIAKLPNLRHLDLRGNRFTQVPRALLEAKADAEINLLHNPLPNEEIRAVRDAIAQRRAAGQPVPHLILPPLAEDVGELREAVANQMNVHTGVLTQAFKKRLDALAKQFPDHLNGTNQQQHHAMTEIETRLLVVLDAHALHHAPDAAAIAKAREIARLMIQKGQSEHLAYVNDFQDVQTGSEANVVTGTAGHALAYTFLALEAQWAGTPEAHRAEARANGMSGLIAALNSGSGMCDTRLCEEVLQMVGLPLSDYAQAHPEVVAIQPVQSSIEESREIIMAAARQVLTALLETDPAPGDASPPAAWRSTLAATMQRDHPNVPAAEVERQMQHIELAWETFHDMVVEQGAGDR
jgi:Leucine-rich repeat (LRR) protein